MNEQMLNDLEQLAILFRDGGWRELEVKCGDFSLLFSMDPEAGLDEPAALSQGAQSAPARKPLSAIAPAPVAGMQAASQPAVVTSGVIDPSWQAVTAPNLGTFYRSPKPGSPPFVEIGQRVGPGTEICLLEVMKLFTSVSAGISGKIAQVCAADAELVEGGQVLFYIQQD